MPGDNRGIAPLNINGNVAENWRSWRARFENYLVASEVIKKDEATQCAQLLHYIGEEAFRTYQTFIIPDADKNKLHKLLQLFEEHFLPKENINYQRYEFFSYRQQQGQTIEQFITQVKERGMKCKLEQLMNDLIKTMIIAECQIAKQGKNCCKKTQRR